MPNEFVPAPDSWAQWANHVLAEISRAHKEREELRSLITDLRVELATLKIRASLWGAGTGGLVAVATALAQLLGA